MRRVADERRHVGLLHRDHAARPRQPHRFAHERLRLAGGAADKARVHEIEGAVGQAGGIGIALHELDRSARVASRVVDKRRIGVESDHAAACADTRRQQIGDAARPAAHVEAMPARADADPVEHDRAVGRHGGALHMQALDLACAALERIMAGRAALID